MDDDDAAAERHHVRHVVARQQDGRAVAPVVLGDEAANPLLHRHVQADRRLVEKEHLRPVQKRAHDLHLHALAERKLSHRLADEVADVQQFDHLVTDRDEVLARQPVDRPVELERVHGRQIPLQLVSVPHHERHLAQVVLLAARGDVAENARLAARGEEEPGEHLERRGLAGAVRAEKADDLTGSDFERDCVHGAHVACLAVKKALGGCAQPGLALRHLEDLRKLVDVDD